MRAALLVPVVLAVAASGCGRTVVDTGREPASHGYRDEWVMGMLGGLVMVESVDSRRLCPFGVARLVTEQSLPNLAVQMVTAGFLSPRTVELTCAAPPFARSRRPAMIPPEVFPGPVVIPGDLWRDHDHQRWRHRRHRD